MHVIETVVRSGQGRAALYNVNASFPVIFVRDAFSSAAWEHNV